MVECKYYVLFTIWGTESRYLNAVYLSFKACKHGLFVQCICLKAWTTFHHILMLFFTLFWSSQNSVFLNLNVLARSSLQISWKHCYISSQKITSMKPTVHCSSSVITGCNNDKLNDSEQCIVLLVHCSIRSLIKVTEQPPPWTSFCTVFGILQALQ